MKTKTHALLAAIATLTLAPFGFAGENHGGVNFFL